jgi:hypothetical protein
MAEGPDSFLDKWRARWPEWTLAEVFLPRERRQSSLAWLALRQELLDAAWGGSDPRPGEAKLGWWQEELQAWHGGMRRHPLGTVLQPRAAPWERLGASLPFLAATRGQPALARLRPFAEAVAAVSAALAPGAALPGWEQVAHGLAAQRLLGGTAGEDAGPDPASRLRAWPRDATLPLPDRLFHALLRERLRVAAGGAEGPPTRIRSLLAAWRAARGT